MVSTSKIYAEVKTILLMYLFQLLILVLLVHQSRMLQEFSWFSGVFWTFGLITQVLYLVVALKDPGFWPVRSKQQLPNNTFVVLVEEHPLADQENIPTIKDDFTPSDSINRASNQDINSSRVENQDNKNTRFCSNCQLTQSMRTKHCRDCSRCVNLFDHHCPWVGNCIGQNNRIYFFWYIFSQCCQLWMAGYACILSFQKENGVLNWILSNGASVFIMLVLGLFGIMVNFLLGFHCYLALANFTTWEFLSWNKIEYFKGFKDKISPFSRGCFGNFKEYCCERFPPFKQWEFKTSSNTIK